VLTPDADRINRGARATSVGTLRPSIVLYDEAHPLGDQIGELQAHDMKRRPDVLLIMGTSLKVHGLKHLIKDFAKVVHERKGIVVFVNATAPNKEWEGVIDYHVQGPTDDWVDLVQEDWKKARPQDWELQTILDSSVVHTSVVKGKPKAKSKAKPKTKPKPLRESRPSPDAYTQPLRMMRVTYRHHRTRSSRRNRLPAALRGVHRSGTAAPSRRYLPPSRPSLLRPSHRPR
jgi:NAD-dependent histone deacetylase SIR2